MGKHFQTEKTPKKYNYSGHLRYMVKYKVRKMAKSLLKLHCYCPMLLVQTTKTTLCLQTKAIVITFMGFYLCSSYG